MLPYSSSKTMFAGELSPEEKSVRGTFVTGLDDEDIECLDEFEGNVSTLSTLLVLHIE
jgi:hypothetical protein